MSKKAGQAPHPIPWLSLLESSHQFGRKIRMQAGLEEQMKEMQVCEVVHRIKSLLSCLTDCRRQQLVWYTLTISYPTCFQPGMKAT